MQLAPGLNVFLSGSTGRVYQLQVRSSCRMRYLHYSTLENTRSFIKRIAKRKKKKIFLIPPPVTTAEIRPSRNLAEKTDKKMKIPNSGLNVFLSGSTGRVYQLQDRSPCRMRYLHYSTLENTRSFIKRISKQKKKISLIPPPVTAAEISPSRNLAEKTDKK